MSDVAQFPYVTVKNARGEIALRPLLPVTLSYGGTTLETNGLLDTGADVNVLPYHLGITLSGNWETARTGLQLSGNLARYEARGILLSCTVLRCSLLLPGHRQRTCLCCSVRSISSLSSTCASCGHAAYLKSARKIYPESCLAK